MAFLSEIERKLQERKQYLKNAICHFSALRKEFYIQYRPQLSDHLKKIVLKTCLYFFADISEENGGRVFFKKRLESLLNFALNDLYLIHS